MLEFDTELKERIKTQLQMKANVTKCVLDLQNRKLAHKFTTL